jgi:hypothetical protein
MNLDFIGKNARTPKGSWAARKAANPVAPNENFNESIDVVLLAPHISFQSNLVWVSDDSFRPV